MAQVLKTDQINTPVVDSITVVRLPSDNIITIGGQQYTVTNKTMNGAITGAGGLDTGSLGASLTYNLFAVSSSNIQSLVGSLASIPAGFTAYKFVGSFKTNGSSQIIQADGLGLRAEKFTTNGTFTVPAGTNINTIYKVTTVGAGGSGGASNAGSQGGSGGGGGGTAIKYLSGLSPGQSVAVTVGIGGTPVGPASSAGVAGTTSSFGSFASATGGAGGAGSGGVSVNGGIGTIGDILISGGAPSWGGTVSGVANVGGIGGSSTHGGGGKSGSSAIGAGTIGGNFGGGGGGGSSSVSGAGAPGVVIIEWTVG